jgi:septal ring factor EnvC (AmiA/AmiB activator)
MQHPTPLYLFACPAGQPDIVHYASSALKINLTFGTCVWYNTYVTEKEHTMKTLEAWEAKIANIERAIAEKEQRISKLATENKFLRRRVKFYKRRIKMSTGEVAL